LSLFIPRWLDQRSEWTTYREVLDTLLPGARIPDIAARATLTVDLSGSREALERIYALLDEGEPLARRTFLETHTAELVDLPQGRILVLMHFGDCVEIVCWPRSQTETQSTTAEIDLGAGVVLEITKST
jgi:hypothetical protein